MSRPNHNYRKVIVLVAVVALLFRAAVFLLINRSAGLAGFQSPDTASYLAPAEGILKGDGFAIHLPDGKRCWETLRTPLYPLAIAGFRKIFGDSWMYAMIAAQMIADSLLVLPIMLLVRQYRGERVAILAGFVYAVSLGASIYATKLLTENMFAILSFLGICLSMLNVENGDLKRPSGLAGIGLLTGIFFGMATLTRPLGLYPFGGWLCLMVAISFVARWRSKDQQYHKKLKMWACALAVFLCMTTAWVARNGMKTGYWSISSIDYVNLVFFRAAPAEAYDRNVAIDDVYMSYRNKYGLSAAPIWDESAGGLQVGKRMKEDAIATIWTYKLGYAKVAAAGAIRMMFGPNRHELIVMFGVGPGKWLSKAVGAALIGLWIIATIGYCMHREIWPVLALGLGLIAISAGYEAYARFRVVLEPFLAVGFGLGADYLWSAWKAWRTSDLDGSRGCI